VSASPSTPHQDLPSQTIREEFGATNSIGRSTNSLIVNADDWGRDVETTDRILDCVSFGTVSSASAMVFMADSERAADLATQRGVDCGLHLNFTTPFSTPHRPSPLREHHERVIAYLCRSRLAQTVYHPGLASSFRYLVDAQVEEFERLLGSRPRRLDGHHHMHLCANVLLGKLLPAGTTIRRNFSFQPGEKGRLNRLYRSAVDRMLAKHHRLTDFFFSLPPLEPASRVDKIVSMAKQSIVEVETHPVKPDEYRFLMCGEILRRTGDVPIARGFTDPAQAE
jgi:chitin disaccharide deacetylase